MDSKSIGIFPHEFESHWCRPWKKRVLASLPERSKGLRSGCNVFVLVGSNPTACTQTAILRGEYRVPSDPRSQAPSGPVSTIVGDQIGSPGAVCIVYTRFVVPYSLGG